MTADAGATTRRRTFSVVIPAFNEEGAILATLRRVLDVRAALAAAGVDGPEVIVVDDGSSDATAQLAGGFAAVRVIRQPENRGYGAALKTGFAAAAGDLVGFLDADGTYPAESFPALCAEALRGADMVVGTRLDGGANGMPLTRRLGNRFFTGLVSALGESRVGDSASGMRVLRRGVLQELEPLPDGLNFTPILSLRAGHQGLRVVEVPIPYAERIGASKLSVPRDGAVFLHSIARTALAYNPVRVLGVLGLLGIGAAALIGAALVAARLRGVTELGPWGLSAVFLALVSGVGGASLFGLGASFNYLITLLRREPVRFGPFGRPLFARPLEHHFGWAGGALVALGLALGATAVFFGSRGWDAARLSLYLVGAALLVLFGLQLVVSWLLMGVLRDVVEREARGAGR